MHRYSVQGKPTINEREAIMSKKHFIALAKVIKYSDAAFTRAQIMELASFCKSQNARFNTERWLAFIAGECGPNGGKVNG